MISSAISVFGPEETAELDVVVDTKKKVMKIEHEFKGTRGKRTGKAYGSYSLTLNLSNPSCEGRCSIGGLRFHTYRAGRHAKAFLVVEICRGLPRAVEPRSHRLLAVDFQGLQQGEPEAVNQFR
ncbi:MAG: hypothetical protein EXQ58_04015 [Acidobacteria bacterium]|nr:hypothetical protein [Acidobacteriota bacterium]